MGNRKMIDYNKCECHESAHAAGHRFGVDLGCDGCPLDYWQFHANPQPCAGNRVAVSVAEGEEAA